MKRLSSTSEAPGEDPSGFIRWNGECIPCLGIVPGMSLNVVIYNIATKLCELTSPSDVSNLSLQCALDIFNKEETGDRTIAKVLQLLIDNECGLKELIDLINDRLDDLDNDNLVLNLRCLVTLDAFGNPVAYNEQSVLQALIDEVCSLKSSVTTLSGRLTSLQTQVDNLDIPTGDEVIVTTTISGPKVVSQALIDVSKNYTDYKAILGTDAQIQTAISRQTSNLNTLMSGVTGWVTTPSTEAQSVNNLWLLMTNFAGRIKANEACCASSCDDIAIGFITSFDGSTVILTFSTGAGTKIPIGFTDCGSTLTITNSRGITFTAPLVIAQGYESEPIDVSSFTRGEILSFSVDVRLCSEAENCQKCISKDVNYTNDCCELTNTGSEAVIIIYTTTINTGSTSVTYTHSVTLQVGESFILPPNSIATGSTDPDSITASCGDDIPLVVFDCYAFVSPQQNDSGAHTEIFQENNIQYTGLNYNGVYYPFGSQPDWSNTTGLKYELENLPILKGLILSANTSWTRAGDGDYGYKRYIVFSTLTTIGPKLELVTRTQLLAAGDGYIYYNLPAGQREIVEGQGNAGMPECPTITST